MATGAEGAGGGAGAAVDPVSAIAGAVDSIFNTYGKVIDALTFKDKARWDNLPEWLSPADFQEDNYTLEIILGGLIIAFMIIVGAIVFIAARKR